MGALTAITRQFMRELFDSVSRNAANAARWRPAPSAVSTLSTAVTAAARGSERSGHSVHSLRNSAPAAAFICGCARQLSCTSLSERARTAAVWKNVGVRRMNVSAALLTSGPCCIASFSAFTASSRSGSSGQPHATAASASTAERSASSCVLNGCCASAIARLRIIESGSSLRSFSVSFC